MSMAELSNSHVNLSVFKMKKYHTKILFMSTTISILKSNKTTCLPQDSAFFKVAFSVKD